ncbi:biogenesis of lysosome-related organelles complex 1 subunit 5-like isoform X2 [Lingula anatina]|uniref:Biogenesis of lysosome-related organelles complex 1 subunit 5 n=1 Tax=Lingula anatina TaxID=7574 RepID=A0A1S3IRY4_LINAN|nr:biogenesis of lysosome-related organelles complex 1 subunit 5-like isoform X1 [Lingula anatina]XP_023932936.1 biogenesis of lysosome-related organelles complex 1 subunit 5-like isoform X2 [Lingula anatina]|eukprot:XP_013400696.1 biogenesis of lysosome-related organelles complex 1 subunit 5-like isoform X1 [Lingula anatina]
MAADKLIKDIHEIYARLFDHKPVVSAEINFFVKEFEEKHGGEKDTEQLSQASKNLEDIAQTQIPLSIQLMEKHVSDVVGKLNVAIEICNKISTQEADLSQDETLKQGREMRAAEWSEFIDDMSAQSVELDREYESSVLELKNYYTDLEQKLKIR